MTPLREHLHETWQATDTGNAAMMAEMYGDILRYDHKRRRWLIWSGHRWEPDRDGHVTRLAQATAQARYAQAQTIGDLKMRLEQAKWAIASESRMRLNATIELAKDTEPIANSGDNWDSNTWLLGASNGVADLRSGQLLEGSPGDGITMTTGIDFDPEAKCPRWEQFLVEVFGDTEVIDWVQRAVGYTITGETSEQCVFIGHGAGANGKSTFSETLNLVLGDYAFTSPFSTFELQQRSAIPNDLAALEFRRFVSSSETNDNTRLNEARLKAISGGDRITARFLHQEHFSFYPHLKLWLFVNHKPKVVDDSQGFWRRVRLIPFARQFVGDADDKHLKETLRNEAPGILAWCVRGCLEWQKRGLDPVPASVQMATEEYRSESDALSDFISEKCTEHPSAAVKAAELYSAYKEWAAAQGLGPRETLTATAFGRRMGERHAKEKKGVITYRGIGLLSGRLVEGFEASIPENDVSSMYTTPRVKSTETIHNCPSRLETIQLREEEFHCHDCGSETSWLRGTTQLCSTCHPNPGLKK